MEQAKEEVQKLADQMKQSAEQIQKGQLSLFGMENQILQRWKNGWTTRTHTIVWFTSCALAIWLLWGLRWKANKFIKYIFIWLIIFFGFPRCWVFIWRGLRSVSCSSCSRCFWHLAHFGTIHLWFHVLLKLRIVGQRWYHQADGRVDFNKLLSTDNPKIKAISGLCNAILMLLCPIHSFIPSSSSRWLRVFPVCPMDCPFAQFHRYRPHFQPFQANFWLKLIKKNFFSHAAVLIGAVCAAIEIYEGVKIKNRWEVVHF